MLPGVRRQVRGPLGVLDSVVSERARTHGRRFSGAGCRGLCAITGGEGVLDDGVLERAASIMRLRS